jgi:T4-like virus tail tube protein gp19|nr:MAG TPA: Baseplate wedge protein [Caudoviricetes sp.]DAU66042.1 MAG TPA: Baseplate wedge protein [Bacteriophage sp.]DAN41514.1 MAG TPA: Baseplate wedge protein [Caudoviricetes sp.]DAR16535.1 MAG TPA: Baseplate wedge protein [Caudoviricetes sp.]DAS75979.1 MAG TPA: Baseplate wedge protein [Caudoviricetes sp.]
MAANLGLDNFLANMQGGGLRPNLFKVILAFPAQVANQQAAFKLQFTAKATSIPASNLGVAIAPYMGREAKFAGDRTFDDWNITVLLDTDMVSRDAFTAWSDAMNGHVDNVALAGWGNPSSYMGSGEVHLLNREGETVKVYNIKGTFPTVVGEINLDWATNNAIAEFPVTMAVNWFEAVTGSNNA